MSLWSSLASAVVVLDGKDQQQLPATAADALQKESNPDQGDTTRLRANHSSQGKRIRITWVSG